MDQLDKLATDLTSARNKLAGFRGAFVEAWDWRSAGLIDIVDQALVEIAALRIAVESMGRQLANLDSRTFAWQKIGGS